MIKVQEIFLSIKGNILKICRHPPATRHHLFEIKPINNHNTRKQATTWPINECVSHLNKEKNVNKMINCHHRHVVAMPMLCHFVQAFLSFPKPFLSFSDRARCYVLLRGAAVAVYNFTLNAGTQWLASRTLDFKSGHPLRTLSVEQKICHLALSTSVVATFCLLRQVKPLKLKLVVNYQMLHQR